MSLRSPTGTGADLYDEPDPHPVRERQEIFHGLVFDVLRDRVDLGEHGVVTRDYLTHPGAVVVVAAKEVDGVPHVLLIQQYRHASGGRLWELPAGLRDREGEPLVEAAARELAEEVDLRADTWHTLTDTLASPGIFAEPVRVFLARDLHEVAEAERHEREGEEASIRPLWVPLQDAVDAALAGRIGNASTVIGLLAAQVARVAGWDTLRPADAAVPELPLPPSPVTPSLSDATADDASSGSHHGA